MKIEIRRLSPHQNAKVFAVLMTLSSLFFIMPVMLLAGSLAPGGAPFPWGLALVMPVIYLVFGYVITLLGCLFYNFMTRFTGGLEFSTDADGQ